MQEIWQSATGMSLILGPFVDVADGVTPETGIDLATADSAIIYKHGASSSISIADATWTALAGGWYALNATSTMFDTLGQATVRIHDVNVALPVWKDIMVMPTAYWYFKYGTTKLTVASVSNSISVVTTVASISSSALVQTVASVSNSVWWTTIRDVGTVTGGVIGTVASVSALGAQTIASISNSVWFTAGTIASVSHSVWFTAGTIASVSNSVWWTEIRDIGSVTGNLLGTVASVSSSVQVRGISTAGVTASSFAVGAIEAAAFAAGAVDSAALNADAVDEILDEVIEGTTTVRHALKLMMSFVASKVSGGGTATITFRDIGDTKNRIVMTVDADGNRSAVVLDPA